MLDNHKDNPVFSTDVWHSDETFRLVPPMGSILRCIRRPPMGGDALWADMCAAYDGRERQDAAFPLESRPTQHYAANAYDPERRTMQRVTIKGEQPV